MSRSKSSNQWLQEHFDDPYVKKARSMGYRSRAVFKLMELQEKDNLIQPHMNVLDLGAAPGGWSQYVRTIVAENQKVVALDILAMEPIEGVEFIQGDFREDDILEQVVQKLQGDRIHLLLSDMAPNMSGNKAIDQPRSIFLGELALDTAQSLLAKKGTLLIKMFQGAGFEIFFNDIKKSFSYAAIRKPNSSRSRSNEVYILAKGFK